MTNAKRTWLYMVRPPRPTFLTDATEAEQASVSEHFEYLKRLTDQGIVWMAGRCDDARFGIAIFEAEDEASARRLVEDDPAVRAGVFPAELIPFRVALWRDEQGAP